MKIENGRKKKRLGVRIAEIHLKDEETRQVVKSILEIGKEFVNSYEEIRTLLTKDSVIILASNNHAELWEKIYSYMQEETL